MPGISFVSALRTFASHHVDFILVGGLAVVLQVLTELDAIFRMQPARRLKPKISHLSAGGHLNLMTTCGPVDLLSFIGKNLKYSDLFTHSSDLTLGEHFLIRVLNLDLLIALKEDLGDEKDIAVLPILRRTLSEKKKHE